MAPWKTGGQPAPAKAVFRVLFVEFADGSEFGSSNWGYELPDIRKRTMERLQEAMDAFQDSGEEGLRKALTTARARSDNQGITAAAVNEITEILEAKGSDAAVAKIQERLTAARARGALSPRGGH